jgi:predicted Fe-Mo cluster-binding NifX family protein
MKIAITIEGQTLDSMLDSRFGRAAHFMLYETETGSFEILDNTQNLNAAQGAGIQSAQNVSAAGAEALITGHTGPKAFAVLQKARIPVYHSDVRPIREIIEDFKGGKLTAAGSADVESHWV